MGQSYMPIVGYTDKTGAMYGAAAFLYEDGRPGYQLGCYGVSNFSNFHSITLEGQKRGSEGTDLATKVVLSRTFDNYYGEGDATSSASGLRLSQDVVNAEASALFKTPMGWSTGPVLGIKTRKETGVENLDKDAGFSPNRGFADSANSAVGLRAVLDQRDSTLSSTQGRLLQLDLRAIPEALAFEDGSSDAWQAQAEWREFTSLSKRVVLGSRLKGGISLGEPGYAERYQLGGTELLRGFEDNRFRGKQFYCLQEELRLPVWRQLGAALSSDLGDASDSGLTRPRYSLQAGLRLGLPPSYGMKARFDIGYGDDGSRSMSLQFGQTF
jgi:outer membrane protein assembly factor BamA